LPLGPVILFLALRLLDNLNALVQIQEELIEVEVYELVEF